MILPYSYSLITDPDSFQLWHMDAGDSLDRDNIVFPNVQAFQVRKADIFYLFDNATDLVTILIRFTLQQSKLGLSYHLRTRLIKVVMV